MDTGMFLIGIEELIVRKISSIKSAELFFRDILNIAGKIRRKLCSIVRIFGSGSFFMDFTGETDIGRRRTDIDIVIAFFDFPLIRLDVEVTEALVVEIDTNFFFLTRR